MAKPNIGERRPARVRADVTVNLSVRPEVKAEWEGLRKHDVCFLVTVRPQMGYGKRAAVTVSQSTVNASWALPTSLRTLGVVGSGLVVTSSAARCDGSS